MPRVDDLPNLLERLRRETRPRLAVLGPRPAARRVTLLASSFDPLTLGHVALASAVSSTPEPSLLVYSPRTLPKEGEAEPPMLPELDRLEVIRRFCEMRRWAMPAICSHGLLGDQVAAAREALPGTRVDLALGSDKAVQLLDPAWYEDRERVLGDLLSSSLVRYAVRSGDEGRVEAELRRPENRAYAGAFERLELDPEAAAVSAREVRRRARGGEPFEHLVPPESVPAIGRALER